MDNEIVLTLPPLPGTDEPHPGFMIDEYLPGKAWGYCNPSYPDHNPYKTVKADNIIAAAAIAHYWNEHWWKLAELAQYKHDIKTCVKDQIKYWSAIASGSRDYDNCKIVAYEQRGN